MDPWTGQRSRAIEEKKTLWSIHVWLITATKIVSVSSTTNQINWFGFLEGRDLQRLTDKFLLIRKKLTNLIDIFHFCSECSTWILSHKLGKDAMPTGFLTNKINKLVGTTGNLSFWKFTDRDIRNEFFFIAWSAALRQEYISNTCDPVFKMHPVPRPFRRPNVAVSCKSNKTKSFDNFMTIGTMQGAGREGDETWKSCFSKWNHFQSSSF